MNIDQTPDNDIEMKAGDGKPGESKNIYVEEDDGALETETRTVHLD
jgi:hypothetical protein